MGVLEFVIFLSLIKLCLASGIGDLLHKRDPIWKQIIIGSVVRRTVGGVREG